MKEQWLEWAIELQSLAQAGLTYGKDIFDRERYERIREISAEIMAYKTDIPVQKVKDLFRSVDSWRVTYTPGTNLLRRIKR